MSSKKLNNLTKVRPFFGKYKEIKITYDFETLGVEADGLTSDGFWENILVQYDVNDPQSYAFGVYDSWSKLFSNIPMSVVPERGVLNEGWFIDETE